MFWIIVGAILFVAVGLPVILHVTLVFLAYIFRDKTQKIPDTRPEHKTISSRKSRKFTLSQRTYSGFD